MTYMDNHVISVNDHVQNDEHVTSFKDHVTFMDDHIIITMIM